MTARELRTRYESGLWMLPAHMIYGVQRYIEDGVRPGGFLFELLRFGPDDEKALGLRRPLEQLHEARVAPLLL